MQVTAFNSQAAWAFFNRASARQCRHTPLGCRKVYPDVHDRAKIELDTRIALMVVSAGGNSRLICRMIGNGFQTISSLPAGYSTQLTSISCQGCAKQCYICLMFLL